MRVAIQSLLWGPEPPSLEKVFREASEAGYDGIEMAIQPEFLAEEKTQLIPLLQKYRLSLVGIARGSFEQKVSFVRWFRHELNRLYVGFPADDPSRKIIEPGKEYPYVYIDEIEDVKRINPRPDPETLLSSEVPPPYSDVTFALHPHMFKSVQTLKEASESLRQFPQLKFLPDTAQSFIAGDSPAMAIKLHYDSLIGVHVNDWVADYGRSYHFYGRGFVDLGHGDVPLMEVFQQLKQRNYDGWIIAERNNSTDPAMDAKTNRDWFCRHLDI